MEDKRTDESSKKGIKMLKLNLLADWTPKNLEPASIEEIALITAAAFTAAAIIALAVMAVFNLLHS